MFQNKEHNVYDIDYGSASMFHWGIPKWNKIAVRTVDFTADDYLLYCSKPAKRSKSKRIKQEYPQINYAVVLAYMPGKKTEYDDYSDTMLPDGIESVHPHYAISWRNNWMLKQADYVVTYITHFYGGAAQYAEKAKRQKK